MKTLKRLTTLGDPLFWQLLLALITFAAMLLFARLLSASTERRKDILFVGPTPHCIGDAVECAESLHFNGEWTGTKLCRAAKCVRFEDIFMEKR